MASVTQVFLGDGGNWQITVSGLPEAPNVFQLQKATAFVDLVNFVLFVTNGGSGGAGTVTSVNAQGADSHVVVTGGPITTSGTLMIALANVAVLDATNVFQQNQRIIQASSGNPSILELGNAGTGNSAFIRYDPGSASLVFVNSLVMAKTVAISNDGFIDQNQIASALLKASAGGRFVAAVSGTDYAPPYSIQRIAYTGGVSAAATVASDASNNIIAFLNGSGSSTTLTVTLPTGGFDGQTLDMSWNQSATTVAYAGAAIIGGLTASSIGSRQRLVWDGVQSEWR